MSQPKRKVSAGQVIPVRLPKDEKEAAPYIRILEMQDNRNQYLLDLIIKKRGHLLPGGSVVIELPTDISYMELDWISKNMDQLSLEFLEFVKNRSENKPPVVMNLSEARASEPVRYVEPLAAEQKHIPQEVRSPLVKPRQREAF